MLRDEVMTGDDARVRITAASFVTAAERDVCVAYARVPPRYAPLCLVVYYLLLDAR